MAKIKIGQIGVGHAHAAGWMKVYRQSNDYEVVGVCESDPALRAKAAASSVYKDLKWMTRDQLLATPGLKAVAVETQVKDLLANAQACVDAGMHVQLDKPAGSSLRVFKRVLDTAASKHLLVQMGYMYRYSPAVLLMREMLSKGWLGEVFEVHTVMSKVVGRGARRALAEYPGGIMFELGCHIMDLAVGVLGKPDEVSPFKQHASSIDDRLVDNMLSVLSYPRAIATVKTSAMEVDGFARRHFVVCGSEGTFHIQPLDSPSVRVTLSKARDKFGKGYQEIKFGNYPRYVGNAAEMARIIRQEKDPTYSYDHDLAVQEAVLRGSGLPIDQ